jgi:phosphopentomutase
MKSQSRDLIVLIVLDGVGVGELPDAAAFQDVGSNTLGNLAVRMGGLDLPNLHRAGLGNILPLEGLPPVSSPVASFGRMAEQSFGKDSISGHWELMGCRVDRPFPLFPDGFPPEIIREFEGITGRGVLGNRAASGTEIIEELGSEHLRTGDLIVYTSADSVFQVAVHTDVVPLRELYDICSAARNLLRGDFEVARVIARPFHGRRGAFKRTPERREYSVVPPVDTVLDSLVKNGIDVLGVGKVDQLFGARGFTCTRKSRNNDEGITLTIRFARELDRGLVFTNLVDFDMLWGHRNDAEGFHEGLRAFDRSLPRLMAESEGRGLMILTADHGCDPTMSSTDHTREYVPLLVFDGSGESGGNLGFRKSFSDVGATVARFFNVVDPPIGESFLERLPFAIRERGGC